MGVDDELLTGQSYTIIGDLTLGESFFWNGQVHHDLGFGFGQFTEVNLFNFKIKESFINIAGFTLC